MKVKDLLKFNPEADIEIIDSKGRTLEVVDYGWEANDSNNIIRDNSKQKTKKVFLDISVETKEKEWWEDQHKMIKTDETSPKNPWIPNGITINPYTDSQPLSVPVTHPGDPNHIQVTFSQNKITTTSNENSIPYQDKNLYISGRWKVIELPQSKDVLQRELKVKVGSIIYIRFELKNRAGHSGGRSGAHYVDVSNLNYDANVKKNMSLNVLSGILKTYKLEKIA